MPGRKKARRFEPRYGVTQAAIDVEAGYLAKEVENYRLLASSDVSAKLTKRHADSKDSWDHLQLLLDSSAERDRQVLQSLLFRDLYLVLELYVTYLRSIQSNAATVSGPAPKKPSSPSLPFSEWLFDPS